MVDQDMNDSIARLKTYGLPSGVYDLREKALQLLDFQAVRMQLAEHTHFFPARSLAFSVTPSYQAEEVEILQQETAEGHTLIEEADMADIHTSIDPADVVDRATLGGVLTGEELWDTANSLKIQLRVRLAVLKAGRSVPLLASIAKEIPDLKGLAETIRDQINSRGEVLESATPSLGNIRIHVRQAYENTISALTQVIQSQNGHGALQDQVISVRSERLVVQVKTEMHHRIPGIVHGASNTGSTLFVEPLETVGMCNAWRKLVLAEEREVARVLEHLSAQVGAMSGDIQIGNDALARLDLIMARARYSRELGGVPALSNQAKAEVNLHSARHPLLGNEAVPINIKVGPGWSALVITGPNTGGKTVAMKTVGLLALMHQSGLHIPACQGSSLPIFDGVYVDVGDQQSIEQSTSTFGSHIRNVIDILGEAGSSSLVLLDELGTCTDPEEGSAIAKAVLSQLATHRIITIATTHYRTVAAYAEASTGMMNTSVQLDANTLKPTYRLNPGIPGRSHAMSIASQLGLGEEIMEKAHSLLDPQYLQLENWLKDLQLERDQLSELLRETERERSEAESIRADLESQINSLISEWEDIRHIMRSELYARYYDVRRELRRAEAAVSWSGSPTGASEANVDIKEIKRQIEAAFVADGANTVGPESPTIMVGDHVSIQGLNLKGFIASLAEDGRTAKVNIGKVRLQIDVARLSLSVEGSEKEFSEVKMKLGPLLSKTHLDLRGLRIDEAVMRLEDFLDKAARDGLATIRVVHGRGTGALRHALREHLDRHPLAKSYGPEAQERGGNGATFVELA